MVEAGLGGEGQPEEQHDEEVADGADGAEQQLEASGSRSPRRWRRARRRSATAVRGRCGAGAGCIGADEAAEVALPRSKKLVSMPWLSRKVLTLRDLRLDGLAEQPRPARRWWRRRDRQRPPAPRPARRRRSPSRTGCGRCTRRPSALVSALRRDAQQHAGEDQQQGGGKIPGEDQQRREQHDADAADRDGPGQIVASS